MSTQLLSYLPWVGLNNAPRLDDDLVDRWNHRFTVALLVMLSVWITTIQHFGDPMHCWVPGHFTNNYEKYTDHICWVSNTYTLPQDKDPVPRETPEEQQINYYQWVPLFLLFQAMFFYAPCVIWRVFYPNSGVDLNSIISTAAQVCRFDKERKKSMEYVVQQIDRYLDHYPDENANVCSNNRNNNKAHACPGKKQGNFLVIFYTLIKLLYLGNSILQMFILNWFLSTDFHLYGVKLIGSWISYTDYPPSRIFPRSTLCDFNVRALGNVHRHTVQCVLPINFYNEKIYLVVWFWLVITVTLNVVSLLRWSYRFFPLLLGQNVRFTLHFLKITRRIFPAENPRDLQAAKGFVRKYLRQDGVFILRLMKANADGIVVAEVVKELFDIFEIKHKRFLVDNATDNMHMVSQV